MFYMKQNRKLFIGKCLCVGMKSTAQLTMDYIKEHPTIKSCLKKELINYSSLARVISKDLGISKKSSKEAILVAARRYQRVLAKEESHEKDIREFISSSEIEIKNKIMVLILNKPLLFESIEEISKKIRKEHGLLYFLEGSDNYTVITQEKYASLFKQQFKQKIEKTNEDCAIINFKTSMDVEGLRGFTAYLAGLFSENGINIIELLSCWKDNIFVVKNEDVQKVIQFLHF